MAIALLLASAAPVQAVGQKRSKTVVAKERIGKSAETGAVWADEMPADQRKVMLVIKSKRVEKVDQIAIAWSCNEPDASPDEAMSKAKWFAPEGGVELPAKLTLRLPKNVDSQHCEVSGGMSAAFDDGLGGSLTMKLVAVGPKKN